MVKIFTTKSSLILENLSPIPKSVPNLKIIESESAKYFSAISFDEAYSEIDELLPIGESLKDVVQRIKVTLKELITYSVSKKVLVVAHGNSIRAMVKLLDNLSDEEIVDVNIPTGIPLAYKISDNQIEKIGYLGDQTKIEELQKEVELQSKLSKEEG